MSERRNIKISESGFEDLNEYKPDNITWSSFLGHLQEAYRDPRPRLPRLTRETDKPLKIGDPENSPAIGMDSPERAEVAEIAEGLLDEINFRKICRESDSALTAKTRLLKELLADPDLSGASIEDSNYDPATQELSAHTELIAEEVADRVVTRMDEDPDE